MYGKRGFRTGETLPCTENRKEKAYKPDGEIVILQEGSQRGSYYQ